MLWLALSSQPHGAVLLTLYARHTPHSILLPAIISLCASANYCRSAQCHHIQARELKESQLSENRISHLRFVVQKQVSPREKFKSSLPFLTEQFPAPVQGIQISVIIPDTTNQFFPFTLYYVTSVSLPRWERDCVRQQKDQQKDGTAEGGWMNWQLWLKWCLPMRWLQMRQMPSEGLARVNKSWSLR